MKSEYVAAFKAALVLSVLGMVTVARADETAQDTGCAPRALALQLAVARAGTDAQALGLQWTCPWRKQTAYGELSLMADVMVARWRTTPTNSLGQHFIQFGVTPSLRWQPPAFGPAWFLEAGIGANVITPRYHRGSKRFSTEFNFGDHAGIGRHFGAQGQHEWVLRFEHFSNGGIDLPNPGENFVQLRYAYYFRQ